MGDFGELAMEAQTFAGVVDPFPEPGPGGDEGFVGEVHRAAVEGDQSEGWLCRTG
ncbi:hypothetical protein GCM10009680_43140 [Streptomyces yatensis]|uniref:Uncharacterized protein n=1 Tax=Streptomyces yatensis TaxID=155177 RepID=A0ABN2I476_9ACTN